MIYDKWMIKNAFIIYKILSTFACTKIKFPYIISKELIYLCYYYQKSTNVSGWVSLAVNQSGFCNEPLTSITRWWHPINVHVFRGKFIAILNLESILQNWVHLHSISDWQLDIGLALIMQESPMHWSIKCRPTENSELKCNAKNGNICFLQSDVLNDLEILLSLWHGWKKEEKMLYLLTFHYWPGQPVHRHSIHA
jgi:hypothetical protein